ncbi:MAG: tRNA (adenosine(37)-N6)-dimethylallyltransferase MiaA [Candidatus Dormibacteraeota bacterium]|nr:tRNA (adenosine(37)-N6)-dimethylallyltransferase MiaA [Candidatus Dormibacteraeota bacterium]
MSSTAAGSSALIGLRVPVIMGPTGVGKSRAAFEIARRLGGEVVVCDSRQVYADLDIATNKPLPEELAAVPHHLVGIADPKSVFNVFDFVRVAGAALEDIAARGRMAVVEGGSVLWADAFLDGFTLGGLAPRPERRAELEALPTERLAAMAQALDPAIDVDLRNRFRVVRAIEVLEVSGPPLARLRRRVPPPWVPIRIGLDAPLEVIESRLASRSRRQVERGLLAETRAALDAGVPASAAVLTGIGYAEAVACLEGTITESDLPEVMARNNRRYARRQLRWLRRDPRITWFDATADPVPGILSFLRGQMPGGQL